MKARQPLAVALVGCVLLVAACGGDDKGSSGSTGAGAEATGATKGAKVIDVKSMDGAKGDVTFCTGKDTNGAKKAFIADFNTEFASQGLKARILEFPESADEQRNQFVQRQRAKSSECDVFNSDVIWTAEFAGQKWLYDLTPYIKDRQSEFIPSPLETAKFDGKYWGVPQFTNAGFLYYRDDQVSEVPATWQAVYKEAAATDGIVYQGAAYEGLTVNFLELAFAAGGKVLSDDGAKAEINSPQNLKALEFMANGIKDGAAPKAVTTYMEEPARRSFEAGRATFMRNWPNAYALGNMKGSDIKGKFKVAPYPEFEGGGRSGILGGADMVISVFSENPGASLQFIDFATGAEMQKQGATEFSDPPILTATYDEAAVKKALPFAAELKQAVEQAKPRPVSPVYTQISQAIYKNVNAALAGDTTPQAALEKAQADMEKALQTF